MPDFEVRKLDSSEGAESAEEMERDYNSLFIKPEQQEAENPKENSVSECAEGPSGLLNSDDPSDPSTEYPQNYDSIPNLWKGFDS